MTAGFLEAGEREVGTGTDGALESGQEELNSGTFGKVAHPAFLRSEKKIIKRITSHRSINNPVNVLRSNVVA